MSEKNLRGSSRRQSVRSLQSSQTSDRGSVGDDDDSSVFYGGDSMSFAMRSTNQSFLSVGYRQDNDTDWDDDDDGRRSVRSAVSAASSRHLPFSSSVASASGLRSSRLHRGDGSENLEASLNSLRSSRRSTRRRGDNSGLENSFQSRASGRSAGSRANSRRSTRQDGRKRGGSEGSFLSDGASEDLVTQGFSSPIFQLGPGTFTETRSVSSSRRGGANGDDQEDDRRSIGASETFNSSVFGDQEALEQRRRGSVRRTRRGGAAHAKLSREAILRKTHVPLPFVSQQLAKRHKKILLYRDLFLFIPLLIMFSFFAEYHISNVSRFSLVTQSLRQQYERRGYPSDESAVEHFRQQQTQGFRPVLPSNRLFTEVRSVRDYNDFYVNTLLTGAFLRPAATAVFMSHLSTAGLEDVASLTVPPISDSAQVRQSLLTLRLVGALRARTIRVKANSSALQENLYEGANSNFSRQRWSRRVSPSTETTQSVLCSAVKNPLNASEPLYVHHACEEMPYRVPIRGALATYHCGGYMFEVPFNINTTVARGFMSVAMSNCSLLSAAASRFVALEFFAYLPALDGYTQVKFLLEVSAGGYSTPRALFRPFFVYTALRRGQVVFSAVVLAYVVFCLAVFIAQFVRAVRGKRTVEWLCTWYHWIDLGVLACAFAAMGAFFQWVSVSLKVAEDIRWPMAPHYPLFLDYVESVYVRWIEASCATTIFLFIRLFRFTEFFAPTEVLWKTLIGAVPTCVAILVVYVLMLVGYSLCGWAVFGPFSPAFRTLPNALVTLALFFISDTFYYPIDNVNEQFQFLFFWSYMICVFAFTLVTLCSTLSNMLVTVSQNYADGDWAEFMVQKLVIFREACRWGPLKRFVLSVLGIRRDDELMQRLIQQLHNFNRVQQDFYLFSVRERIERDIDEQMREFREHRAGQASAAHNVQGLVDDNDTSRISSALGESSPRNLEDLAMSLAAPEMADSLNGIEGESREVARQMISSLAQSMSAYMGNSVEASDLGFGPLLNLSALSPGMYQHLDDNAALVQITEHVCSMYASHLIAQEIEVRYTDWTRVVPAELYAACGGRSFFEHVWVNEIVPAWTAHLATPAEQKRTEFIEHTQYVTRGALSAQLAKVKLLDTTLRKLEAHIAVAQDILDARNADDRESSDGQEV